ncbi:MAG: geranylgeranylglyceryl/heptaprenylglyceryl phosphate synthase [Desulfurococcaceae archaeon]
MGKVHEYIIAKISSGEKLHFTLVDPDKVGDLENLEALSQKMVSAGTDGFLIGGSIGVTPEESSNVARILKKHGLPVIVFPGNINCLTPEADAVLFMILMNTLEPYYLIQAQVAAAPIIAKYRLETLPTGYLVVDQGTAVAHIGRIHPIPRNKPELVAAYALAAEMLGLKYLYLEAGSGAPEPVPSSFPQMVKRFTKLITIVGGGIRSPETARLLVNSGADIIVTGTIVEKDANLAEKIVKSIKERNQ